MTFSNNSMGGTPISPGSLVDGVLSIKGPSGQSVLQLALSGDSNSAHLEVQIGARLYTLDIRPKPRGAATIYPSAVVTGVQLDGEVVRIAQEKAIQQRMLTSSLSKTSSLPGDSMS